MKKQTKITKPTIFGLIIGALLAISTCLVLIYNQHAAHETGVKSTSDATPRELEQQSVTNADIDSRKAHYRKIAAESNRNNINILANEGLLVPTNKIESWVRLARTSEKGDFRIAELVRLLYLTDEYDDLILPYIADIDYWLTEGEQQYVYWSENHMILWMSSAYLLRQREGWQMKSNLDQRLHHWLDLKADYGFYEFFSTTYAPYTLGAMLNLYDFANDEEIRRKANVAIDRLVREHLLVYNDMGAFYPAAGRNYIGKYTSYKPRALFWIVTGRGPFPEKGDYDGAFISTSSYNFEEAANSYRSNVDIVLRQGHRQADRQSVHAGLSREERTIFQWSSGGYFHPDTAADTAYTVEKLRLTDRSEFRSLAEVAFLPDGWMNSLSTVGGVFSKGSNLSKVRIDIFKNKNVVLTSLDNYYPGYKGYQQWPWAATVEDIAVWTQSGKVGPDWEGDNGYSQNTHLPKVKQTDNVALITYKPMFEILHGTSNKAVNLHWPEDRFDETDELYGHEGGNWLVGRRNSSYIAVLRAGTGVRKDGHPRNWGDKGRQMWAVVVGNEDMHGSFSNFKQIIGQAAIRETYDFRALEMRKVYVTRVQVDGIKIRSSW